MTVRTRLFLMMVLQLAVWGAWAPKLFPYMGMLGFSPWQQSLVGSCWGIAAVVGIFFSNQFADRRFSAGYLVFSLLYVPTLSVSNAIAFANLKDPAKDFGAIRMGGTVGWILVS